MSRDDRDQRGGHRVRKASRFCPSCIYCTPLAGRIVRSAAHAEAIAEQLDPGAEAEAPLLSPHAFDAEHGCLRCGANELDAELYGIDCTDGAPIRYTTESKVAPPR